MNLANPAALLWAALAVPIVIFYILKIRLRRAPVSTMLFWRQIYDEKQPRSLWQRLRHLVSLLVQLALLMLLVMALTEPYFNWEVLQARRLVLVVDNSASMNATDGTPSRLALALDKAKRFIDSLRFRDELAIVAGGTQPQVVCGLTGHQRTLQEALDRIEATDGPTRVPEAAELAERLLADHKNGQVVVLSDGCFADAEKLADREHVRFVGVGQKTPNVGITQFQVRRSLLDPIGYQILAAVRNASDKEVECRLEIDLDDSVVDVVPLKLEAGGSWQHTFEKTSAEGGRMRVRLDHVDALPADNEATALLPMRAVQPVTLITQGNLFLQKVFEANQLVRLSMFKLPEDAPAPGPNTVTVFHRRVPEKLPDGAVLVIDPQDSCDLWQAGEKIESPLVTKQDSDSPLMMHVRLDNVLMPDARQLTFATPPHVLASSLGDEPLFAAITRPTGKVLVLTVNLDEGDLPLRTAFPILAANALTWFAGNLGELRKSLASGTVTEAELPEKFATASNRSELFLWTPGGKRRPLPQDQTKLAIGPLDQCGVWSIAPQASDTVEAPGTPLWEAACNLASTQESDLRPPQALLASPTPALAVAGIFARPIWFYLVAMAWLLAAAEWYLYQRRWIS